MRSAPGDDLREDMREIRISPPPLRRLPAGGGVERDERRGFSYLVEKAADLAEILPDAPDSAAAESIQGSGGLLRARRSSRSARRTG